MNDKTRGIYRKFDIQRTDGSSELGEKHHHCRYFVLDLEHDPFAVPALKAYATACRKTHPQLSHDLHYICAGTPDQDDGTWSNSPNTRMDLKLHNATKPSDPEGGGE